MSMLRRIHHRTSRRQLIREALYCYLFAYVFMVLYLHFVGIGQYDSPFHREHVPFNTAARQAVLWALLGAASWVAQEYVFRDSGLRSSDPEARKLVLGGAAFAIAATVVFWRVMLPLWALAAAVALYLRHSRPKDSL